MHVSSIKIRKYHDHVDVTITERTLSQYFSQQHVLFQLYQFFMWAGIAMGAALMMFLITRQMIGPLEKFKRENLQKISVEKGTAGNDS